MHARAPLFSSHVQARNKVLVYKPNKDSCLFFHVGHNLLFFFLLKKTHCLQHNLVVKREDLIK